MSWRDDPTTRVVEVEFAEFYRATAPRTLRYAYGLTGDLAQAQDVVQEAYVRAWQRWRRLSAYDDAEAWLRLVVSRLVFDWWRHLRVRRTTALPAPASVPAPSEETVLVVAALKQLPERHRQALALHYLMDMSVTQIAKETGVSENTVKSWLSRGRTGLAAALREEVDQVKVPTADHVAELGKRRRRTRVVASVTAAGLAVLAVIVLTVSLLGRDRALPPPPTVTPTGSPMAFSPLQRVGGVQLPALAGGGVGMADGRGFALLEVKSGIQVTAVDLATGTASWPPVTVPGKLGENGRTWVVPGAVVIFESGSDGTASTIAMVDTATGKVRWRHDAPLATDDVYFLPGVMVFADHRAGEVTGIDLGTGAQKWHIAGPVSRLFGMTRPEDLARADGNTGVRQVSIDSDVMFIADGKGTVTEYTAASGSPTGRAWHGVQPSSDYLAYNGDIYLLSARELYRLHLADGKQTRLFAGTGVLAMSPCGATGVCLIDAGAPDGDRIVVAISGDREIWRTPAPGATNLAPIGRKVRVAMLPNGATIVLDERGEEVFRLPADSGLARLDAGNLLGFTFDASDPSGSQVKLSGIPADTMRPADLGTLTIPGGQFMANGDVLLVAAETELVVYRLDN